MRFRYLEYFTRAVESQSLNRAARQMDISPQTLCAGVAALERCLGYKLLERSPSGVTPTRNGQILFADAQQIKQYMDKWMSLAPTQPGQNSVTVRLGASTTLMSWIVPQVIVSIKSKHPHIYFDLHESFVEEVFHSLIDKRMLGLITCVTPKVAGTYRIRLAQNDMEAEEGPEDGCVVVINKQHPLAALPALATAQLGSLRVVFNPRRDEHFVYRDICRYFSPSGIIHIPEQKNLLRLIALDPSLAAILPRSVLKSAGGWTDSLRGMDVSDYPMPGPIWLIYPRHRNPAEEIVLEALRQCLHSL